MTATVMAGDRVLTSYPVILSDTFSRNGFSSTYRETGGTEGTLYSAYFYVDVNETFELKKGEQLSILVMAANNFGSEVEARVDNLP